MKNLADLRLGLRLGAGFALLLALMGAVIAMAVLKLGDIGTASDRTAQHDWVLAQAAAMLSTSTGNNARSTMELFFAAEPVEVEQLRQAIEANRKTAGQALDTLARLAQDGPAAPLVGQIQATRGRYVTSFTKVAQLLDEGRREEASRQLLTDTLPVGDKMREQVAALTTMLDGAVEAGSAAVARDIAMAGRVMLALGLAGLVCGAVLAWGLTRSITAPIRQAVAVARTVAAGDLSSYIERTRCDETGELLKALHDMNEGLLRIVAEVRQGSDAIASGSTQIATGNTDLSRRTEEQAAHLQRTAASMEQLTCAVQHSAATAAQANQLAHSASEAVTDGGAAMGRVVATMQDISASSQRIADIIGVIDDIAFQTNILALNASVEAARAGEQGRGFAVVAGEVRTLAQRCAAAAREIKALISTSVEQVDAGSRMVGEAGQAMGGIVAQVRRVSDLIGEISCASAEQSQGIAQVGDAVMQLDQVTQQNAALVEQSAAAAESLKLQAARLARVVGVFRLHAAQASRLGAATPSSAGVSQPIA